MSIFKLGLLALLIAACGLSAQEGVFAVSDVYSIYPDGTVGERADGKFGELAKKNGHFDAATKTVKLYGARNEEVAVQLVIPREGQGFGAKATAFGAIPAERVTFSAIGYMQTSKAAKPVHPDVIVPLDGSVAGITAIDVPLKLKGLPAVNNKLGLLLMEVWIPKDAPEGVQKGALSILQGGNEIEKLNVEVTVLGFELPDRPTYRMDYLAYGSPLGAFKLDATLPDGGGADFKLSEEALKVEQQSYAVTLDNRGFLNVLPYSSQRGHPRYAYPVQGKGADAKILSYEGFDHRYGPLLEGKVGKYKMPPACFTLAFNINYPYTMQGEPKKQFDFRPYKTKIPEGPGKDAGLKVWEDSCRAIAQQTLAHFAEKGWKNVAFEIYHNQKANIERNLSPWKLDEPTSVADYKGLRYLFNVAKWGFEGAADKGIQVVTRIDIGHWECDRFHTPDGKLTKCYKGKEFNTGDAAGLLKPVIDRWVSGIVHLEAAHHHIADYNTEKVMFDAYGTEFLGVTHMGGPAGECWKHAYLGIEGRVIYKDGMCAPANVDTDCILYSGLELGFTGTLASRRVKIFRNSVNDYDYLVQGRKKDASAVEALLEKLIKIGPASNEKYRNDSNTISVYFTNNVEDFLQAKLSAAAIVTGKDYGAKLEGFSKAYSPNGAQDHITGYD
ncbi:MAG: hypothetical protein M5U26_02900 [Planctomycetota bacterium]|nr:hypothetical protein [Planctomycetota bacterium]